MPEPKRLPLIVLPGNRDGTTSKDARLVNAFIEKDPLGEWYVYKRPGMSQSSQPSGAAGTGRGIYNWRGDIYSIVGGTLYKGSTSKGAVDTTNGVYRFDSCLGATPKLVLGNGVKAYTYTDAGGLVVISDVDFPATFLKGWAYLDATTYVARSDAGIQGSALNDPTSWDPLNVLVAQIEPDRGKALAKQLVYAIMLKEWSTEVFYDAGNATGSPLAPVQGAKVNYGCISSDGVQDLDGVLYWPCTNKTAAPQVLKLDNLKAELVSEPAVERLLAGANFDSVYSFVVKIRGHRWYVLTLKNSNLTLAFDAATGIWAQWTDGNGNYLPIVSSTFLSATLCLLQHESNGWIYQVDSTLTDAGTVFPVDIYTPPFDGGVDKIKVLNLMRFLGDQTTGSYLDVRVTDDDYRTWSNFRRVDLSKKRPILPECGSFYRRAWHLRHKAATAFRLKAVDLWLDVGSS